MIDTTAAIVRFRNRSHPRHRHDEPQIASALARTYAMVLAGGRGSRLMQLTDWRAKPAVPFGGKNRIIDFALSNCVNSGIRRIGVATQYKAHSLIKHLQRGWSFLDADLGEFLEVLPAQQRVDGAWYMGTANAVLQNIDIIQAHAPEHIIVLAGDHIYKMDYAMMLSEHLEPGCGPEHRGVARADRVRKRLWDRYRRTRCPDHRFRRKAARARTLRRRFIGCVRQHGRLLLRYGISVRAAPQ